MSLSSLIVQREIASIRQVEEALARQVLYGGDLVMNLLEVVQIPEAVLVPLLAEEVGMEAAPIGMLPPPTPAARALVPEDVAARRAVIPLSVEGDTLLLAVSERLARDDLEELSFALGVRIEERIAPSVRIAEALARVYGIPLERRMARLVGRLAGVDPTVPNSLPPLKGPKATVPPLPGALTHDLPKLNPPGMPVLGTLRLPEPRSPTTSSGRPSVRPGSMGDARALPSLLREPRPGVDAPRRRGPVTMDRVTEELGQINDREGLLHLFFDFGRQFFEYSAIFVVHSDVAEGRDAFGSGATRDRVLAIGVPLDIPSMLRTVRERAVPLCTVPEAGGLDAVLMGDLKRDVRSQVLVVPIVVRSRVVAFLVADDGSAGIDPAARGEVTTVAALVGREFERLIVRMKLGGFTGETPTPERRVDARRVEPKKRRPPSEVREAGVQALEQAVTASLAASPLVEPPPEPAPEPEPVPQAEPEPVPLVRPVRVSAPMVHPAPELQPEPEPVPLVHPVQLPAEPFLPVVDEDSRPGALRPEARPGLTSRSSRPPVPLDSPGPEYSPLPTSYQTLRTFPAPAARDDARTDRSPPVRHDSGDRLDETDFLEEEPAIRNHVSADLSPPPPTVAVVRRPSGRPIPREEEPDGSIESVSRPGGKRMSSRPPPSDLRQARLLREIDALTAQFVHSPPSSLVSGPGSLRSGVARNVPPHRPPSSSRTHEALPSVIVDPSFKIDLLADAFVANPKDEHLEAELLRLGQQAMPSIMKHFPGPITIMRDTLDDSWPRVAECGPVLRLIAGQRRVALPFVLARTENPETETRFWATYLLTELAYPEAIPAVVARLFDDSKRVRRAARLVAHVLADTATVALVDELHRIVRDPRATSTRRVVTLDALGEMRAPLVVPVLLSTLGDEDEEVGLAARRALMLVSRQDFGRDTKKWVAWWQTAAPRHRVEWLIDALTHDVPALRRAAGQELKALTEQYFGYYDDLPKKDRERAQQKYRDWWRVEGQARFKKV